MNKRNWFLVRTCILFRERPGPRDLHKLSLKSCQVTLCNCSVNGAHYSFPLEQICFRLILFTSEQNSTTPSNLQSEQHTTTCVIEIIELKCWKMVPSVNRSCPLVDFRAYYCVVDEWMVCVLQDPIPGVVVPVAVVELSMQRVNELKGQGLVLELYFWQPFFTKSLDWHQTA